jgi:hypothetical protein
VPTTRGHHTIIFHTKPFELTFRDYCGINVLLGHQYGSHYLYLNLKKEVILGDSTISNSDVSSAYNKGFVSRFSVIVYH